MTYVFLLCVYVVIQRLIQFHIQITLILKISYQFSDTITIDWLVQNMPQFLFPDLSKQRTRIEKPFIGVLATHNRKPVGLILATSESSQTIYRIHSFLVHPQFQRQGIGLNLLKEIEAHSRKRGGLKIEGMYRSHWKSVSFIQKILKVQQWETPKPQLIIAKDEVSKALNYFSKSSQILDEFSIYSFTQLKKSDIEFIQQNQRNKQWFDSTLNPFVEQNSIDKKSSFLLKKEQEIIGWIVSHRINKELNEWTSLFIDPKYRTFKLTYALIQYALRQQKALGIPQFLVTSKLDGNAVSRLLERGGEEYGVFCTTSYYSQKALI